MTQVDYYLRLGYPHLPRPQSKPSGNIGQGRIRLDSLRHAAPSQGHDQHPRSQGRQVKDGEKRNGE